MRPSKNAKASTAALSGQALGMRGSGQPRRLLLGMAAALLTTLKGKYNAKKKIEPTAEAVRLRSKKVLTWETG